MITAPFNFVPLNEKVFFPPWTEDVSHDIPFADGKSGVIDITITAKSPIFIRDHEKQEEFCQYNGKYYIPSTSVKGMIRSVLEIMSFSKMSQFDDDTYAVRDLNNKELYMSKMKPTNISCGWLKKVNNEYTIEDCGKVGRIKHDEIDKIFNNNFVSKFKKGNFANKAENKTAKKKYDLIDSNNFTYNFKHTTTSAVGDKRYVLDNSSSIKGTIVLTGQPSGRDESRKTPKGKVYEFIFFDAKSEIPVEKKVYENFLFAYFDKRDTQPKESPDWTFWKERLNAGGKVPVFFQKNGKKIAHFGLSYLYKLPYTHSIKDGIPKEHLSQKVDLSETLFGYVSKKEKTALKGRVSFSHFKAIKNIKELAKRTEILGTPRASYYPIYIRQDGTTYETYMNADFELAGRKRYPIHSSAKPLVTETSDNENVGTAFTPLSENVIFSGKIRYHNLKKEELGALISALTFHNTQKCYHNIGMAKSLGYGKIELTLSEIENRDEYLKEFEMLMMQEIDNWSESQELQELFSMATPQQNRGSSALKYIDVKEFSKQKNAINYLKKYTELENIEKVSPLSLVSNADLLLLKERQKKLERQKEEKEREQKRENEYEETLSSNNVQKIESFIGKYPEYEKIQKLQEVKENLQKEAQNDKFKKVNDTVQKAWDSIHDPKYRAKLQKALQGFINKWELKKNSKGSEFVLELVKQAKEELK